MSEVNYRRNGMKYSTTGKCWGMAPKAGGFASDLPSKGSLGMSVSVRSDENGFSENHNMVVVPLACGLGDSDLCGSLSSSQVVVAVWKS